MAEEKRFPSQYDGYYEFETDNPDGSLIRFLCLARFLGSEGLDAGCYMAMRRLHAEADALVATDGIRMHYVERNEVLPPGEYVCVRTTSRRIGLARTAEPDFGFLDWRQVLPNGDPAVKTRLFVPELSRYESYAENEFLLNWFLLLRKLPKSEFVRICHLRDLAQGDHEVSMCYPGGKADERHFIAGFG